MQESDAGTYYMSSATTSGEVRCRIPVFPLDDNSTLQLYNWTISLTRDNATYSNGTQVLVYDEVFVTCIDDGNQTTCVPAQVNQSYSLLHTKAYVVVRNRYVNNNFSNPVPMWT